VSRTAPASSLPARPAEQLVTSTGAVVDVTDPTDGAVLRRVAESLWQNLGAEVLVLMMEREGSLDRVATIGLPQERAAVAADAGDVDPVLVRKLLDGGPLLVGGPEERLLAGFGVPIDPARRLLAVPLVDGDDPAFGLAVVGEQDAARGPRQLDPSDLEHVCAVVGEKVPLLHAWWKLRGLALASGRASVPGGSRR
jgi:hypothetical protein